MRNGTEYMARALALAEEAALEGEVPVGCVIVRDGRIIGEGRNRREGIRNALAHAEIEAIDQACRTLGGWRLIGCTLYVTLEPCTMCAGAILQSRISRVFYGAADPGEGAVCGIARLFDLPYKNRPDYEGGVLAAECQALLDGFFSEKRGKNPAKSR